MLADYRASSAGSPGRYALYGFEAMSVVLDSIRAAGARGNDRQAVIDRFFATADRDSVLGRYSMQADGETDALALRRRSRSLGGRTQFYRAIDVR